MSNAGGLPFLIFPRIDQSSGGQTSLPRATMPFPASFQKLDTSPPISKKCASPTSLNDRASRIERSPCRGEHQSHPPPVFAWYWYRRRWIRSQDPLQFLHPKQYRIPRMIPLVSSSLHLQSPLCVYLPSLYGLVCYQAWQYFTNFGRLDGVRLKATVRAAIMFSSSQCVLIYV